MSTPQLYYLLAINAFSLLLFGWDKLQAKRQKQRIPESRLWLASLLGGSLGALLGMMLFRHKTAKLGFRYGIPACLFAHLLILLWLQGIL